jgi:hypothetical protein
MKRTNIGSCISTGPETKNDFAGEDRQEFTRLELRVAFAWSEQLLAEARESSGTLTKENVRRWKSLPSNG